MNLYPISFFLLFINTWIVVHNSTPPHFTGHVSINCGSSDTSATRDGREWHGDLQPKLSSFVQIKGSSSSSTVIDKRANGDYPVPPYSTARLSRFQFSYGFQVNPGNFAGNHAVETVQTSNQSVSMLLTSSIAVPAIPLEEMKKITGNFSSRCIIGNGFRGEVYRAVLKTGHASAIKKLECSELDGELELISILSSLKHENVVQLLGYCIDGGEQVLAYEFAPHGSLHDILHRKARSESRRGMPVLSWTQRVKISIGAAKGLEYIHEKAQTHRNIKSSNVLVFNDCDVGKITDLRQSNPAADQTECLSVVAGTLGYQAPESILMGELSWRSDVYNFGVVLMELLTGHQPFDRSLPKEKQHLVKWATPNLTRSKVHKVVDAHLEGNYPHKAVAKMAEVAALCVQFDANSRPRMSIVVKALQSLQAR